MRRNNRSDHVRSWLTLTPMLRVFFTSRVKFIYTAHSKTRWVDHVLYRKRSKQTTTPTEQQNVDA